MIVIILVISHALQGRESKNLSRCLVSKRDGEGRSALKKQDSYFSAGRVLEEKGGAIHLQVLNPSESILKSQEIALTCGILSRDFFGTLTGPFPSSQQGAQKQSISARPNLYVDYDFEYNYWQSRASSSMFFGF